MLTLWWFFRFRCILARSMQDCISLDTYFWIDNMFIAVGSQISCLIIKFRTFFGANTTFIFTRRHRKRYWIYEFVYSSFNCFIPTNPYRHTEISSNLRKNSDSRLHEILLKIFEDYYNMAFRYSDLSYRLFYGKA